MGQFSVEKPGLPGSVLSGNQHNAVWKDHVVADEDLKRMADAAERIVRRQQKRNDERVAAVAWIKAERDEIGLTALAEMLGVDAANLGKVIEGKRSLPISLMQKIQTRSVSNERKGGRITTVAIDRE